MNKNYKTISELVKGETFRHIVDPDGSYWRRPDKERYTVDTKGPLNSRFPHIGTVVVTKENKHLIYYNADEVVQVVG